MSYIQSYQKSHGSRNIICYLTSCSFSCSKIQKWIHLRLWCIALANFCLHCESSDSLIFLAPVMASLTPLLTGFCCSHWNFVSRSPWLWPLKCPFSPRRLDVPNSPVTKFILLLHYSLLVTELYSSLSLNGHGLFLNSVSQCYVLFLHYFNKEFNIGLVPLATLTLLMIEHAEDIFKIYEIMQ